MLPKENTLSNTTSENDIITTTTDKEHVDIEQAIDETGQGRYNYTLLLSCCVITIGTVMEMLGYSLVVPAASCDLNLTLEQGAILKSISFTGFLFAIPWGCIADTTGRKRIIHLAVTAAFIFSTMASFSNSFNMMLILKLLASFFSTASLTLITTYLGESTSKKIRNRYIFIQNISTTGSDFVCYVLGYLVLSQKFSMPVPYLNTYRPWRLFSLLMSLPIGIGAVLMCFLHESPKFLVHKGETEKAMDVLSDIFKANNDNQGVYPVKSLKKSYNLTESLSFCNSLVKQTTPIFKRPLLWKSLQLFLLLSICCSTNNVFFMWFPTMANSFFTSKVENSSFCQKVIANIIPVKYNDICIDNNSINTMYSGMIFTFSSTSLNTAVFIFANWRRTLIFTSFLLAGISCITVNMVSDPIVSMVLLCIIQCTALSIGSVYSYYVDIFPTSCRGLATSMGTMIARIFCLVGVAIVGTTVIDHCQLTFYCWAVFILSGIIAAIFLPTNGTKIDFY